MCITKRACIVASFSFRNAKLRWFGSSDTSWDLNTVVVNAQGQELCLGILEDHTNFSSTKRAQLQVMRRLKNLPTGTSWVVLTQKRTEVCVKPLTNQWGTTCRETKTSYSIGRLASEIQLQITRSLPRQAIFGLITRPVRWYLRRCVISSEWTSKRRERKPQMNQFKTALAEDTLAVVWARNDQTSPTFLYRLFSKAWP